MKRKLIQFLTLVVALLAVIPAHAQDDTFVQEINAIKRTGKYFYEEAKAKTESEARQAANVKLAATIMQFMSNNGHGRINIDPDNLPGVQYKSTMLGSINRVFAYIPRDQFVPSSADNKLGGDLQVEVSQPETPAYTTPEPASSEITTPEPKRSEIETPKPSAQTSPAQGNTIDYNNTDLQNKAGVNNSPQISANDLTRRQQSALAEILNSGNLQGALKTLAKLQSRGVVARFGAWKECPDIEGSYWIIADDNYNIVTILGPGSNRRTFTSGTSNNLSDYSGTNYTGIWFKLVR